MSNTMKGKDINTQEPLCNQFAVPLEKFVRPECSSKGNSQQLLHVSSTESFLL